MMKSRIASFLFVAVASAVVFTPAPSARQGVIPPVEAGKKLFGNPHELITQSTPHVLTLAFADVDGDGDVDVFQGRATGDVPGYWTDPDGLLLNDGTGRLVPAVAALPGHRGVTWSSLFADFDLDGAPDLLLGEIPSFENPTETPDRLLINNGHGRFSEAAGALPAQGSTRMHVAVDVDGDGDLDILCAKDDQDRLYLNDGVGFFVDASNRLPPDASPTIEIVVADAEGDGDADLILAKSASIGLWLNNGNGWFADSSVNVPAGGLFEVSVGDVDVDGDVDIFSRGKLFLNYGMGIFGDYSGQLGGAWRGELVDVDGDGRVDILDPGALYLNDGGGNFTLTTGRLPDLPGATMSWGIADLDGDGDDDYLVDRLDGHGADPWGFHYTHYVLNDGTGHFTDLTDFARELPPQRANAAAIADMDGDGDPDIVTGGIVDGPGGTWEDKFHLFHNDGHGRFTDRTAELLPWEQTIVYSVALGDVDQDGDVDIVLGGHDNWDGGGGGTRLYVNQGLAPFTDATFQLSATANDSVRDVILGDVDGDLDLDILASHEEWPPFADRLMINDGAGNFADSLTFPAPVETTYESAFVDVDGDHDLDIVSVGSVMHLWLNNGVGVFTDTPANLPSGTGTALEAGDVDGDGDFDLVVGRNGTDELYLNNGLGVFTSAGAVAPGGDSYTDTVGMADLDDDGDLDLLIHDRRAYTSGRRTRLLLNDGAGTFKNASRQLPQGISGFDFTFGDLDEDGDQDLVTGALYRGYAGLWINLRRHVAWRTVPRIGRDLVLDVTGRPHDPWLLAYSLGSLRFPTVFGVLFLDPTTLVTAGGGTLDVDGQATFSAAVPYDVGLIGTPIYWQGASGVPLRLTNRETSVITGL